VPDTGAESNSIAVILPYDGWYRWRVFAFDGNFVMSSTLHGEGWHYFFVDADGDGRGGLQNVAQPPIR
jgi:hypothetical protein